MSKSPCLQCHHSALGPQGRPDPALQPALLSSHWLPGCPPSDCSSGPREGSSPFLETDSPLPAHPGLPRVIPLW